MDARELGDIGRKPDWLWSMFLWLLGNLFFSSTSLANNDYVFERPPMRVALVVGNSDYLNTNRLPGSVKDAEKMARVLENLGFNVTLAKNVFTRADFLSEHFAPFLAEIEAGAFVVFYFSGHGFSYGGDSYLTTLNFPATVEERYIFTTFLAEPALRARIADRKPGFFLTMLDACRNIGDLIIRDADGSNRSVMKGLAVLESPLENVLIAYASAPNHIAQGSTGDELSIYTKGVTEFIDDQDLSFDQVLKEIGIFVRYETNNKQIPWVSGPSTAIVHFKPSEHIRRSKKEAWLAALGERQPRAVERFLRLHSVSDYAAAARKWLTDNGTMQTRAFSRVAALSAEIAWDVGSGRSVRLNRAYGPLGMTRSQAVLGRDEKRKRDALEESVLTESLDPSQIPRLTGQMLAAHGEAVVLENRIKAFGSPSSKATKATEFAFGTTLNVKGITSDAEGRTWLKVKYQNDRRFSYISLPETQQPRTIDIGRPSTELFIDSKSPDVPWLVREGKIRDAIADLRKSGKGIGWISIATPNVEDSKSQELLRAQASHAAYLTAKIGVHRGKISIAEGLDFHGDRVRVRFFDN